MKRKKNQKVGGENRQFQLIKPVSNVSSTHLELVLRNRQRERERKRERDRERGGGRRKREEKINEKIRKTNMKFQNKHEG